MNPTLLDIGTKLAFDNPTATGQEIADAILDSIESEFVLSRAINYVTLPTATKIKEAEFKSKRLPNQRDRILERIGNVQLFRRMKEIYMIRAPATSSIYTVSLDGAEVMPQRPLDNLLTSYPTSIVKQVSGTRSAHTARRYQDKLLTHWLSPSPEVQARSAKEIVISPADMVWELEEHANSGQLLSFYDIYQIINAIILSRGDTAILERISNTIDSDIKNRNRISKSDCVREFYRGNDQLPAEMRLPRLNMAEMTNVVRQNLRAIILDELRRLHDKVTQEFIDNKLVYDEYIEMTNRWASQANALFTALK